MFGNFGLMEQWIGEQEQERLNYIWTQTARKRGGLKKLPQAIALTRLPLSLLQLWKA